MFMFSNSPKSLRRLPNDPQIEATVSNANIPLKTIKLYWNEVSSTVPVLHITSAINPQGWFELATNPTEWIGLDPHVDTCTADLQDIIKELGVRCKTLYSWLVVHGYRAKAEYLVKAGLITIK